jgi:hypothetical protein
VDIVCYADDATLIADIEDDLQRLLTRFSQSCTEFDLKISSKKTKSLIISREPLRCKLSVYNTTIEQVTSFNYLDVQITSSKDLTTEVRHQDIKDSRISGWLNETTWSNKYLRKEAKVRIYKSIIRPILTSQSKHERTRRKLTELKTLRRIINKTKWGRMRNDRIRESCEIQNITSWVQRRRIEWSEHISRVGDDRLARKVRYGIPEGKRSRGRPMERWRDALE